MKFLIKFATKGRGEWFLKAIENIILTTSAQNDFHILVTADDNDPVMNSDYMRGRITGYSKEFLCGRISIIYGVSDSKIHAINRGIEVGDWEILLNMSDDMQFITKNWDEIMVERIKLTWGDSLDFFAHFNDGYTKDALATMSILGRDYYLRDNYIYHPSYKSFSCDAEAMFVAIMRGRHRYFNDLLFLHQHPANKPAPNDETYRINSLATPHDTANYWRRLNRYFDEPHGPETPIPFQQYIGQNTHL